MSALGPLMLQERRQSGNRKTSHLCHLGTFPRPQFLGRRRRVLTALREAPGYIRWCVIAYQHTLPSLRRRRLVEHLAHLGCKIAAAIGLAEEMRHLRRSLAGHGAMRISRCVEDLESGMAPAQLLGKLAAVHAAGHDHIGEQEIGCAPGLDHLDGTPGMFGGWLWSDSLSGTRLNEKFHQKRTPSRGGTARGPTKMPLWGGRGDAAAALGNQSPPAWIVPADRKRFRQTPAIPFRSRSVLRFRRFQDYPST